MVLIKTFSYKKHSVPEADVIIDVRHLRNPYHSTALRALDGRHEAVRDYVLADPCAKDEIGDAINHVQSGATVLAIGCMGGRHRSVAIAEALKAALTELGVASKIEHGAL